MQQALLVVALCSFFFFGTACGQHENTVPPESLDETQIQEIDEPGIPPHFDGPALLESQPDAEMNEKENPTTVEEP